MAHEGNMKKTVVLVVCLLGSGIFLGVNVLASQNRDELMKTNQHLSCVMDNARLQRIGQKSEKLPLRPLSGDYDKISLLPEVKIEFGQKYQEQAELFPVPQKPILLASNDNGKLNNTARDAAIGAAIGAAGGVKGVVVGAMGGAVKGYVTDLKEMGNYEIQNTRESFKPAKKFQNKK